MSGYFLRNSVRNAVANFERREVAIANEGRNHIQIRGLPRTALPQDVQRTVVQGRLQGVTDIVLDYRRFIPTGNAWLKLTSPELLNANLRALDNATVSSSPISAASSEAPPIPNRMRGLKGKDVAAKRGYFDGNGPRGGIKNSGKNVVIWGLPGRMSPDALKEFLRDFHLAGTEGGKTESVKIPVDASQYTRVSKHLVRLSSQSEAHRVVRELHMTYYHPEVHKYSYLIRARVVY